MWATSQPFFLTLVCEPLTPSALPPKAHIMTITVTVKNSYSPKSQRKTCGPTASRKAAGTQNRPTPHELPQPSTTLQHNSQQPTNQLCTTLHDPRVYSSNNRQPMATQSTSGQPQHAPPLGSCRVTTQSGRVFAWHVTFVPSPPLANSRVSAQRSPGWGGGGGADGRQVTVSRGGGGLQGYFKANCGTLH